jgi:hypothetical protein
MKRMHHSTGAPRGLGFHPRRAVVIMRPTCWFLFKTLAESTYPAPVFFGWSSFERSSRIELHAPLFQMGLPARQALFRFRIQVAGHSCRPAFIGQGKNSEFPLEFTHMNKQAVSRPHLLRWLAPFPIESHPAAFDCLGGEGPGLEEPGGPQPFIYANLFHNPIDLPDSPHRAVSPLRAPAPGAPHTPCRRSPHNHLSIRTFSIFRSTCPPQRNPGARSHPAAGHPGSVSCSVFLNDLIELWALFTALYPNRLEPRHEYGGPQLGSKERGGRMNRIRKAESRGHIRLDHLRRRVAEIALRYHREPQDVHQPEKARHAH